MLTFKDYFIEESQKEISDSVHEKIKKKTFNKMIDHKSSDLHKIMREFKPLVSGTVDDYYIKAKSGIKKGFAESAKNVNDTLHNLASKKTKATLSDFKTAHDAILDHLHHHDKTLKAYHKPMLDKLANNKLYQAYNSAKEKSKRNPLNSKAVSSTTSAIRRNSGLITGAGLLGLGAIHALSSLGEAYDPDLEDSRRENYQKIHALGDIARKREFGRWGKALHNLAKSGESEEALSARNVLKIASYQSKLDNGKLSVVHKAIVHHAYNHGTKGMSDEDKGEIEKTYTHKMIKDHLKKFPKKGGEPKRRGPAIKKKDIKDWKKYIPYTPARVTGRVSKKVEESMNDIYMLMNSKAVLDYFPEEMGAGAIASGPVKGNTTDSVEIYDKPLGKKKKPDVVRRKPVDAVLLGKFR